MVAVAEPKVNKDADSNQSDEQQVTKKKGRPAKATKSNSEIKTKGVEKVKMKAKEKQPKKVQKEKVQKVKIQKENVQKKKAEKATDENGDEKPNGKRSYRFMIIEAISNNKDRKGATLVSLKSI